jgi:hypothetical protein
MKTRDFFIAVLALATVSVATQAEAKREPINPSTDRSESFGPEQFDASTVKGATIRPTRPTDYRTTPRHNVEPEKFAGPGVP